MRSLHVLAAAACVLLPALAPSAMAAGTSQERAYVGSSLPPAPAPCQERAEGIAGACFELAEGSEEVHLAIHDAVAAPVAAEWRLEGSGGDVAFGEGVFCGETTIPEPDPEDFPVERVRVTVLAPGFAQQVCPMPALATHGTIVATFVTG